MTEKISKKTNYNDRKDDFNLTEITTDKSQFTTMEKNIGNIDKL